MFEDDIKTMEDALTKFTAAVSINATYQKNRSLKLFLEEWGSVKNAFRQIEKKSELV